MVESKISQLVSNIIENICSSFLKISTNVQQHKFLGFSLNSKLRCRRCLSAFIHNFKFRKTSIVYIIPRYFMVRVTVSLYHCITCWRQVLLISENFLTYCGNVNKALQSWNQFKTGLVLHVPGTIILSLGGLLVLSNWFVTPVFRPLCAGPGP
jgi:late competence protein required for DNA uptake (superfamily II DNA/RNA helicase)